MSLRRVAPEALAWAVGVALRLGLFAGFNPRMGYDTNAHTGYMAFIAEHGSIPPIDLVWTANHPPLYYALCAALQGLGAWPQFEVQRLQVASVAFAIARLSVLWWMVRQVLPTPLGRAAALLLAGVLPSAVHGDGMVTNETMNALAGTLAIALAYRAFASIDADARVRRGRAVALFAALLVALLTKISGLLIAASVFMGLVLLLVTRGRDARPAAPIAAALLLSIAIAVPVYARHREETGLLLPTSFERNEEGRRQQASLPPYFRRRPLAYYVGFSFSRLYAAPHYPTAVDQFPIVLLATTFTDYYNYSFVTPPPGVPQSIVNHRPLARQTERRMRAALVGGLVLGVVMIFGYLALVIRAGRRWNVAELVALAVPAAGVLGQLHYATKYPFDYMGLVKSLYLQFGWAPVFVGFGAAAAWMGASRRRWALLAVTAIAFLAVAQYTVHGVFEW